MFTSNPIYIQIKLLKQKYLALPWYKRFWFSLWSYELSRALSEVDSTNPTVEQVIRLLAQSTKAWFFGSIFGLLEEFQQATQWVLTSNFPPSDKPKPGKLSLSSDRVKQLNLNLNEKCKIRDFIEVAQAYLTVPVEEFIRLNINNKKLTVLYSSVNTLPVHEAAEIFSILNDKLQNFSLSNNIGYILDLLSKGKPSTLISAKNILSLCDEIIDCKSRESIQYVRHIQALYSLAGKGLLTQSKLNLLETHDNQEDICNIIRFSDLHNVLNEDIFLKLISCSSPKNLHLFFHRFGFIRHRMEGWAPDRCLRADQFIAILTPDNPHHYLLSDEAINTVRPMNYSGGSFWNEEIWGRIYDCCDLPNRSQLLRAYVNVITYKVKRERAFLRSHLSNAENIFYDETNVSFYNCETSKYHLDKCVFNQETAEELLPLLWESLVSGIEFVSTRTLLALSKYVKPKIMANLEASPYGTNLAFLKALLTNHQHPLTFILNNGRNFSVNDTLEIKKIRENARFLVNARRVLFFAQSLETPMDNTSFINIPIEIREKIFSAIPSDFRPDATSSLACP